VSTGQLDQWSELAVRITEIHGDVRAGFATVEGQLAGMRADAGHLRTAVADQAAQLIDLRAEVAVMKMEQEAQRQQRLTDQRRVRLLVSLLAVLPVLSAGFAVVARSAG
jgi:hypothetical protein